MPVKKLPRVAPVSVLLTF